MLLTDWYFCNALGLITLPLGESFIASTLDGEVIVRPILLDKINALRRGIVQNIVETHFTLDSNNYEVLIPQSKETGKIHIGIPLEGKLIVFSTPIPKNVLSDVQVDEKMTLFGEDLVLGIYPVTDITTKGYIMVNNQLYSPHTGRMKGMGENYPHIRKLSHTHEIDLQRYAWIDQIREADLRQLSYDTLHALVSLINSELPEVTLNAPTK